MPRQFGDPQVILQVIVTRIITAIGSRFSDANCYLSINPDSLPAPSPGGLTCVVSPASGSFDEAYFEGGGNQQLLLNGGIIVKVHSPLQLDQSGRDVELLVNESHGVIDCATEILEALSNWSPVAANGDELTRDPLIPRDIHYTRATNKLGGVEIGFGCNFDWDLTN